MRKLRQSFKWLLNVTWLLSDRARILNSIFKPKAQRLLPCSHFLPGLSLLHVLSGLGEGGMLRSHSNPQWALPPSREISQRYSARPKKRGNSQTAMNINNWESWASVAHACNPSYSGGRDQEDQSLKPVWANSSWDPISKKPSTKRAGGVAQDIDPEFKTQYCKKNKKQKTKPSGDPSITCF
jgi:hypothetical protein